MLKILAALTWKSCDCIEKGAVENVPFCLFLVSEVNVALLLCLTFLLLLILFQVPQTKAVLVNLDAVEQFHLKQLFSSNAQ